MNCNRCGKEINVSNVWKIFPSDGSSHWFNFCNDCNREALDFLASFIADGVIGRGVGKLGNHHD
jgi:hypothetical protein